MNRLLVICGPTASGKSAIAQKLAKQIGCSIINADSRQIYQQLDIGTAKPTKAERAAVDHYGLDLITASQQYTAADYAAYVLPLLNHLFVNQNTTQILCGGTGLYIKSVCEGMDDIPSTLAETRALFNQRMANEGLSVLIKELETIDPELYKTIDRKNHRRVQRALEVHYDTGKPMSAWQQNKPKPRPFQVEYYMPMHERALLYERINQRVLSMLEKGFLSEVVSLLKQYPKTSPGFISIGYQEVITHLDGEYTHEEMVEKMQQHTRNYAKRQLTWFRKLPDIQDATMLI